MARDHPTIRDVAKAAGVSAMSVSRVLNGKPGVGAETARRIEETIQTLGFRPNYMATTFRHRRRLSLIGMIVPNPHPPLFESIVDAVDESVRDAGLTVVTARSGRDAGQERALVESFIERGFDGILLVSQDTDHSYLSPELERGLAIVFLSNAPIGLDAPSVVVDNRHGAREATQQLLRHGHTRIGLIAGTTHATEERLVGYRETLFAHGIPIDPALIQVCPAHPDHGRAATEALMSLDDPPTALFSTNYQFTLGVLSVLKDLAHPVALIAFDDFEAATLVTPGVTVVTQDPPIMGREVAEVLLAQLAGAPVAPNRIVRPHIIPRGSGEITRPR